MELEQPTPGMSLRRKTVLWSVVLAVAVGIGLTSAYLILVSGSAGLKRIHSIVESQYQDVAHLDADALASLTDNDVLVFDVREKREFAVSHLPGAIRVPPKTSSSEFAARFGDRIGGKTLVFYCSVGRRASRLLQRVRPVIEARGAAGYNLKGGIFNWHNERRTLKQGEVETEFVHPFGKFMVPLIERKQHVRFKPNGTQ